MSRKRHTTRSRQNRKAVIAHGEQGKWRAFVRWWCHSEQNFQRFHGHMTVQVKELVRGYRCPMCHKSVRECVHIDRGYAMLIEEHMPAPHHRFSWPEHFTSRGKIGQWVR